VKQRAKLNQARNSRVATDSKSDIDEVKDILSTPAVAAHLVSLERKREAAEGNFPASDPYRSSQCISTYRLCLPAGC
jgi:hypothetical protein